MQLAWACALLAHLDEPLTRELFQGLGAFEVDSFSRAQLAALWGAQLAVWQLSHPMREPHPLLATSIKTYMRLVGGRQGGGVGVPAAGRR